VTLAASTDGGSFGAVPGLRLVVSDLSSGTDIAQFAMTAADETAFVTGELYRRDGGWKFRAVGQGYQRGLAGLATDFGIDVGDGGADLDSEPEAQPEPEPTAAAPVLPPPSFGPAAPPAAVAAATPEPPTAEPPTLEPPTAEPPTAEPAVVEPPADATAEQWSAPPPTWNQPAPPSAAPPVAPPSQWAPPPVPPPPVPPPAAMPPAAMAAPPMPATAPPAGVLPGPVFLQRNERLTLDGPTGPLRRIMLDLSWEPAPGRLSVDLDASVIAFDASGKKLAIVWYQHQNDFTGALQHTGDARGEGNQGATERILIDLGRLPGEVDALVFTINSFHGHTFTDLTRASATLSDDGGRQIVVYDLTDTQPSTAVLMAIVRREQGEAWHMRAIGEYHDCRTVKKLVDPAARQVGMR
jgi:stress response protein SCP2